MDSGDKLDLTLYVKASNIDRISLGDCPFSHRVTLFCQFKSISPKIITVNMTAKPRDFMDVAPSGKVPLLLHKSGPGEIKVLEDSANITAYLDSLTGEPSLTLDQNHPAFAIQTNLFHKLNMLVKNPKSESDNMLTQHLESELRKLDEYLASHGRYLVGDTPCDADFALIPKLYHLRVTCLAFKNYQIPERFPHLLAYMKDFESLPEFINTQYPEEEVIKGWEKHVTYMKSR